MFQRERSNVCTNHNLKVELNVMQFVNMIFVVLEPSSSVPGLVHPTPSAKRLYPYP